MSTSRRLSADFKNASGKVNVQVVLISFKEGNYHIVYAPHLEVTGSGLTEDEAMKSFHISLGMFLDYTVNKKTLHEELITLGWELKKGTEKKPRKINAPSWAQLIKKNSSLENILNLHNVTTSHEQVAIPM